MIVVQEKLDDTKVLALPAKMHDTLVRSPTGMHPSTLRLSISYDVLRIRTRNCLLMRHHVRHETHGTAKRNGLIGRDRIVCPIVIQIFDVV